MKRTLLSILLTFSGALSATTFYQTYPGSNARDYSQSATTIERSGNGYNIYQTYPGSNARDYSQPSYQIMDNQMYQTYPGSNARDYSRPGFGWSE